MKAVPAFGTGIGAVRFHPPEQVDAYGGPPVAPLESADPFAGDHLLEPDILHHVVTIVIILDPDHHV